MDEAVKFSSEEEAEAYEQLLEQGIEPGEAEMLLAVMHDEGLLP